MYKKIITIRYLINITKQKSFSFDNNMKKFII